MHYIPQETYNEPRRRPRLRAALMTAAILTVGVAVAACGGGPPRPGAAVERIAGARRTRNHLADADHRVCRGQGGHANEDGFLGAVPQHK